MHLHPHVSVHLDAAADILCWASPLCKMTTLLRWRWGCTGEQSPLWCWAAAQATLAGRDSQRILRTSHPAGDRNLHRLCVMHLRIDAVSWGPTWGSIGAEWRVLSGGWWLQTPSKPRYSCPLDAERLKPSSMEAQNVVQSCMHYVCLPEWFKPLMQICRKKMLARK